MDDKPKSPHKDTNTPNDIGQSEKDIPTRIEVENMILKGKSDYLQTLIIVVLTLFALLGAVFPFVTSIFQSNRVEREIDKMETSFKELAGKQLRKPIIVCKNGNELLLNSVLSIENSEYTYFILIHNYGEGVAGPIDAYVYFKELNRSLYNDIANYSQPWKNMPSDEPGYASKYLVGNCDHISPQDVLNISFRFPSVLQEAQRTSTPLDCNAMLEVFYGEPTPIKIPFVLRIGKGKTQ